MIESKRKRPFSHHPPSSSSITASVVLKHFDVPLLSSAQNGTVSRCDPMRLRADHPYSIGRRPRHCSFVFRDRRVSKRHCQLLFDASLRKLFLLNGVLLHRRNSAAFPLVYEFRRRAMTSSHAGCDALALREPSNGLFVNGVEIGKGRAVELSAGDRVSLVSRSVGAALGCGGEIDGLTLSGHSQSGKRSKRVFALKANVSSYEGVVGRARLLLERCRDILLSDDPVTRINVEVQSGLELSGESKVMGLEGKSRGFFCGRGKVCVDVANEVPNVMRVLDSVGKESHNPPSVYGDWHGKCDDSSSSSSSKDVCLPPGKNFYLNRLEFMNCNSSAQHPSISLPELIHPVESVSRMFIATFTSDIKWCPQFPETIAFGNNRKRQGIACHHPKLIVLQRKDSIRIVITSANLVEKQWNSVTNTLWWQDFPQAISVDFISLFPKFGDADIHRGSKCDFAAQLAGFMASLVIDLPSQAHWITQLTKYDFGGATGHLIASVPGIHFYKSSVLSESFQASPFLGSVVASVVGLSHLFRTVADSTSARLKALASSLRKSCKNAYGKLEIVLRRNPIVSVDENAVSVLVPNPDQTFEGDCVQLGFLPRNVAKWVSPLWDAGFFSFSGYVCPKEALAAALGENCNKLQLILNVSEGHHFKDMPKMMQSEQVAAFCSLIASIQRCYGLWRLQEVNGASSIGSSINSKFLASFSSAVGKKSLQHFDSEESDPEWGCWNAREELKNPSVRIVFPTIERVKNAYNGILPSRHILCFTEKTWQRLKTLDILHDAIPHPHERIGHPMHIKVVRRCFWSGRDAPSIGWVYCGSHNFSAAAWGRQISNPFRTKMDGPQKEDPSVDYGLHICNYELGIIFTFPPTENISSKVKSTKLDDIILPFVVPAPKYGSSDQPATKKAMRDAMVELAEREREKYTEEEIMEELDDDEEHVELPGELEAMNYLEQEKEEEKEYADILWSQVDSSQSIEQLDQGVADVNLESGQDDGEWVVYAKRSKNKARSNAAKPRSPPVYNSRVQNPVTRNDGGFGRASGSGNPCHSQNANLKKPTGRGNGRPQLTASESERTNVSSNPLIRPPLEHGWNWQSRTGSKQSKSVDDSPVREESFVKNDSVDDEGEEGFDAIEDTDDDLLSDDYDSDTSQKSHETRKKSKWFKDFFEKLDGLSIDKINEPCHCPVCRNGPGAIDWYKGLQPLLTHAKTKASKRSRSIGSLLSFWIRNCAEEVLQ
ncbi:hypothetical protein Fmac_004131 [Flemingia macrophylla]|uniref:FHA domain-containing protein n=1 Tax=Flemingia macrophylla TaxID=520843 RepID=A0ABD1N452_9FABA